MEICLVILQLYIIIGAGFFFAKKFDFDNKILNYFIIYLGLPSLVFVAMYNGDYNLGTFVWPLLYIFVHILILALSQDGNTRPTILFNKKNPANNGFPPNLE